MDFKPQSKNPAGFNLLGHNTSPPNLEEEGEGEDAQRGGGYQNNQ